MATGIAIQHPAELEEKLQLALDTLAKGRLVFVDVTVDGSEHVYPMQIAVARWMRCG